MPKLSLMGYLGMVPFSKMVEKSLCGKPTITINNYLIVSSYLYEVGAIIGKLYSNRLLTLWQLFDVELGKEQDSIDHFQNMAGIRMNSYEKEPESFIILFFTTELAKVNLKFESSPQLTKVLNEKMPVSEAESMVKMWGTEGIGFGSRYPDITDKMLKYQYDTDNSDLRFEMILHSSSVLPKSAMTSAEMENEIINQLRTYVTEYFPDLMKELF